MGSQELSQPTAGADYSEFSLTKAEWEKWRKPTQCSARESQGQRSLGRLLSINAQIRGILFDHCAGLGRAVKAANARDVGDVGSGLGSEDPGEKEMAYWPSSILAWLILGWRSLWTTFPGLGGAEPAALLHIP